MKIAIIGAGWAGLSCAQKIKELDSSSEITIFESARDAGGRAKGLNWKLSNGETVNIDNGQHFVIGAYENTITLLKKTNSPQWSENTFTWNFSNIDSNNKIYKKFELSMNCFFLNLFLSRNKWPRYWYFSLFISWLLIKLTFIKNKGTAKDWLSKAFQPKKLQEVFWRPFIESTTNTDWREASAESLVTILRECFIDFPRSITILHPKVNLSKSGVNFIVKYLKKNGVNFRFGNTISSIKKKDTFFSCVNNKKLEYDKFDNVILALPSFSAQKLWEKSNFIETSESRNWALKKTRGINTLWIALPSNYKRIKKISNKNYWEIRQLSKLHNESFFVIIERPLDQNRQIISIVHSAIDFKTIGIQKRNFEKIKIAAEGYLKSMFDLSLKNCEYKLITEKRATFACQSQLSDAKKLWGNMHTGKKGIWRCSDDCIYGFPSTIESAVISGLNVAESLMVKENQEHL